MQEYDPETLKRLSWPCNYTFHEEYVGGRDNVLTWLDIYENHYPHFVELLAKHVSKDTEIYRMFLPLVKPEDMATITKAQADVNTLERFLNYKCMHNSSMKGKTWKFIREKKYSYYVWSVANTMSRNSRTFLALVEGLTPEDKEIVLATEKGKYKGKAKKE